MVRTTLISQNKEVHFLIPDEYIGKKIEITCLPVEEIEEAAKEKPEADFSRFKGMISEEDAQKYDKHLKEARSGWDRDIF